MSPPAAIPRHEAPVEVAGRPAMPHVATVSGLRIYPLKSAGVVSVTCSRVSPRGLQYDRCWCVLDESGLVQDQRIKPMLSMITPTIDERSGTLVLSAPEEAGLPPLSLPLDEAAYMDSLHSEVIVMDRHKGKWFGRPLHVRSAGDDAAAWIEAFFLHYEQAWAGTLTITGRPSRHATLALEHRYQLARYVETAGRRIGESFKGKSAIARRAQGLNTTGMDEHEITAGFADCAPLHVAAEASLDDLNRRLGQCARLCVYLSLSSLLPAPLPPLLPASSIPISSGATSCTQ